MDTQSSYDQVADEYARRMGDEMSAKPFDRVLLDWLIEKVEGRGPICDMGCGPGQIARYLCSRGADACGIDLSPGMVEQARRLNPGIPFEQGDMLDLKGVADGAFGGIAAFYSIIHIPRDRVVDALCELRRVLAPGGAALIAFHIGEDTIHADDLWGHEVNLDFLHFTRPQMKEHLSAAGFTLEEAIERDPYPPEIEHQSRRAYLFARKPVSL